MARLVFSKQNQFQNEFDRWKIKKSKGYKGVILRLEPPAKNWWDDPDVVVAFNLTRISARLERLMGTNVVRLTDRKYMAELRARIDEDYRVLISTRIRAREIKEVERERVLILEGKTDQIPPELAGDPIFVVTKKANMEITKQRAKLKTSREKYAERLKIQAAKWERERLLFKEQERMRLEEAKKHRQQQKLREKEYKDENAERGLDLLRIDNEDWKECEQGLVDFLTRERDKMKERSRRIPTPYSSDPQDIQNIVRARRKFRETAQRIRQQLEDKYKHDQSYKYTGDLMATSIALESEHDDEIIASEEDYSQHDDDYVPGGQLSHSDESTDVISDIAIDRRSSTISAAKRERDAEMKADIENDVSNGLLVTQETYSHLRFEDQMIAKLRLATNIQELYELAELIIIGKADEENEETDRGEGEGEIEGGTSVEGESSGANKKQ